MEKQLKEICANHAERKDCPVGFYEFKHLVESKSDDQYDKDEVCKQCDNHLFVITELRCPVCKSESLDRSRWSVGVRGLMARRYTCRNEKCQRKLLSFSNL